MKELIVVGGGGHASVVIDAAVSSGSWTVLGFVDPHPPVRSAQIGADHLGDDSALASYPNKLGVLGFGSVGDLEAREKAVERLSRFFSGWAVVVHEKAVVSPTASIGEGTVICAGAIVQPGAVLGRHTVVNTGAIVEHDTTVGDYSQVAPGAVIGGGVTVGQRCWIGLGAAVRDNVTLGDGCVVAMGATVVSDVTERAVVKGTPAR